MKSKQDMPILSYPVKRVELPEEELAYIAGLLDAEACFEIYKMSNSRGYCLQWAYRKTHYDTLKYIGDIFGGRVRPTRGTSKSKQDVWLLLLTSRKAYYTILQIYPFLRIKKRAAQVCINFFELYWRPNSRGVSVSDERQAIGRIHAAKLDKFKTKSYPHRRPITEPRGL